MEDNKLNCSFQPQGCGSKTEDPFSFWPFGVCPAAPVGPNPWEGRLIWATLNLCLNKLNFQISLWKQLSPPLTLLPVLALGHVSSPNSVRVCSLGVILTWANLQSGRTARQSLPDAAAGGIDPSCKIGDKSHFWAAYLMGCLLPLLQECCSQWTYGHFIEKRIETEKLSFYLPPWEQANHGFSKS